MIQLLRPEAVTALLNGLLCIIIIVGFMGFCGLVFYVNTREIVEDASREDDKFFNDES